MLARLPATKWSGPSSVDGIPPRTLRHHTFRIVIDVEVGLCPAVGCHAAVCMVLVRRGYLRRWKWREKGRRRRR